MICAKRKNRGQCETDRQHRIRYSLKIIGTVHVVDVVYGLLQMVGGVLHLLQLPRRLRTDGDALHLVLEALQLVADVRVRDAVAGQRHDALEAFLRQRQAELVDLTALVAVQRNGETMRAFLSPRHMVFGGLNWRQFQTRA